jgi:excinuclease UvrABC nuclease subunit
MGISDILYFGKGTNRQGIRHRVRQYFSPGPTRRTNLRILGLVGETADDELAFVETDSIPEAISLEATLLQKYEIDHG